MSHESGNLSQEIGVADAAFRFIDLFAGIGGLRRGFDALGGECVFTCEIDKYARKTYSANYDDGLDHPMALDIRDVDPADIPEHDSATGRLPLSALLDRGCQ